MTKPKFLVAHRVDRNNVGDMASNPLQYFLKEDEYQVVDIASLEESTYPDDIPVIVGGGGLINNDFMGDFHHAFTEGSDKVKLQNLWQNTWKLSNEKYKDINREFNDRYQLLIQEYIDKLEFERRPRFIWGAGHNGNPEIEWEEIKWPKLLSEYSLIGSRDFHSKSRFQYVPCASCLHPALRKKYTIKNDIIIFEHKKQLIKEFGNDPIPRFVNSGDNIEQTIELLGSANIILTNSYHGVFWGTLLEKRVILIGGVWSSKFKWMKYPPVILGKRDNWKDVVDEANVYPGCINEAISLNENFYKKILERV
jgi:coenzyme F420-reducing hydrogenase delta subunit